MPNPFTSLIYLGVLCCFYLFLTYIFDALVSSNRGYSSNPFGWIIELFTKKAPARLTDLREEDGVNLDKVWKSYKSKPKQDEFVLRGVDIKIKKGELYGLLGPNGAGKTTLIGVLTGILKPTKGKFSSNGIDGNLHSVQVRSITNTCPQFDILWPQLTILDHINLVCDIKGVDTGKDKVTFGRNLMKRVNLAHALGEKVQNLSGGMRRRVSIALTSIGDPKVLIFDEPTTGLDPENRHDIWEFINSLKGEGTSILLTTHILEEADILSDRISIMALGEVLATGTTSELKRKYGSGYKLSIVLKKFTEENVETVSEFVHSVIPSAELFDKSGGSLIYAISLTKQDEITLFLQEYAKTPNIIEMIDDLNVSNSTLEEVFMKVTFKEKEQKSTVKISSKSPKKLFPAVSTDLKIEPEKDSDSEDML